MRAFSTLLLPFAVAVLAAETGKTSTASAAAQTQSATPAYTLVNCIHEFTGCTLELVKHNVSTDSTRMDDELNDCFNDSDACTTFARNICTYKCKDDKTCLKKCSACSADCADNICYMNCIEDPPANPYAASTTDNTTLQSCLDTCKTGDVMCAAICVGKPSPEMVEQNALIDCISSCDVGNGTAQASSRYSACKLSCMKAHVHTSSTRLPVPSITSTPAPNGPQVQDETVTVTESMDIPLSKAGASSTHEVRVGLACMMLAALTFLF